MFILWPTREQRKYLRQVGLPLLTCFHAQDDRVLHLFREAVTQHPEESDQEAFARALARYAYARFGRTRAWTALLKLALLIALVFAFFALRAHAQMNKVDIQKAGGAVLSGQLAGSVPVTCVSGCTPGGATTQDVNIKQYNGATVGATNAVHVQPGTGAVWDISDRIARLLGSAKILDSGGVNALAVDASGRITALQGGTWNVRMQDGAGNALTTNSTTYTAKFALDINILGTLGTAFSTAGKVDVKGADGDVFVRQPTAANLNATVVVAAGNANIGKVGILGNAAATLDSASGGALPTNTVQTGIVENNLTGRILQCDKFKAITLGAAATTEIIAISGSTVIYICSISITGAGATGTVQFRYGTGTTCGTGSVQITGTMATGVGVNITIGQGNLGYVFKTVAGQAFCAQMVTASATAAGTLSYAQF